MNTADGENAGYTRIHDDGEIVREIDGIVYPDDIDQDFFDEVFPPKKADIISRELDRAWEDNADVFTALELGRKVLRYARERQHQDSQTILGLEMGLRSANLRADSLHQLSNTLASQLNDARLCIERLKKTISDKERNAEERL